MKAFVRQATRFYNADSLAILRLSPPVLLSVGAVRFAWGGTSDVFKGTFEGRPVAVKVPTFRCVCAISHILACIYMHVFVLSIY